MTTVTNKNGVEFDIDAIATDLNGKADADLMNLNSNGNSRSAGLAMPSNTSISLTFGASGTDYVAPANGYYAIFYTGTTTDNWLQLVNVTKNYLCVRYSNTLTTDYAMIIPACKGDVMRLQYSNAALSQSWNYFRFYYAVGSESEAS